MVSHTLYFGFTDDGKVYDEEGRSIHPAFSYSNNPRSRKLFLEERLKSSTPWMYEVVPTREKEYKTLIVDLKVLLL